jgi:hypothetical protein
MYGHVHAPPFDKAMTFIRLPIANDPMTPLVFHITWHLLADHQSHHCSDNVTISHFTSDRRQI